MQTASLRGIKWNSTASADTVDFVHLKDSNKQTERTKKADEC
jgi:hypothetical protein